ncbi:YacL family protein [Gallaecimonas xiamenensis]|uniref:Uncharacterized protein n=1 Tax=Gallaecimonas xiamenensis 3-C-1 TaxID=745411 RepID=K2J874_9GAMM|nr:YacL family protein [Gallaecimonas xiamenensis]EKE71413.1 hypothetical protein B3C1_12294 [Gallaecimonas xiamenensis 3-C-1]
MEYQFSHNPFTGRHQVRMEYGFAAFGRFIEDELGADLSLAAPLIAALASQGSHRFDGREWTLVLEEGELALQHHSLGQDQEDVDPDLDLDDTDLMGHCGLEDGLQLFRAWCAFIAPA